MTTIRKLIDISDRSFGKLTVRRRGPNTKAGSARWFVTCSCSGKEKLVSSSNLLSGKTKSCGCERGKKTPKTHCSRGHLLEGTNLYRKRPDGRRRCRICRNMTACAAQAKWRRANPEAARDKELRNKRGIGLREKEEMLHAQGDRCAACETTEPKGRYLGVWATDHDHTTGRLRGILCNPCNLALGMVQDDVSRLYALAAYLKKHHPNNPDFGADGY